MIFNDRESDIIFKYFPCVKIDGLFNHVIVIFECSAPFPEEF